LINKRQTVLGLMLGVTLAVGYGLFTPAPLVAQVDPAGPAALAARMPLDKVLLADDFNDGKLGGWTRSLRVTDKDISDGHVLLLNSYKDAMPNSDPTTHLAYSIGKYSGNITVEVKFDEFAPTENSAFQIHFASGRDALLLGRWSVGTGQKIEFQVVGDSQVKLLKNLEYTRNSGLLKAQYAAAGGELRAFYKQTPEEEYREMPGSPFMFPAFKEGPYTVTLYSYNFTSGGPASVKLDWAKITSPATEGSTLSQTSPVGAAAVAATSLLPSPPPQAAARAAKSIRLDPMAITFLMGYDAELRGNLRQFPGWPKAVPNQLYTGPELERDRTKWEKYSDAHLWVEGWESPEDSFVWTVEVPQAGYYQAYMLGTGRESVVEIAAGDSKITAWVNNGWDVMWDTAHFPPREGKWRADFKPPDDYFRLVWSGWNRMPVDTLYLPAGASTITVRASKIGGDLALYSLELVRPEVERALKEKAEKLRSSTQWLADAKYGLFFHWTSALKTDEDWKATWPRRGERKVFPKNVEDFNVAAFVEMVRETGAGYIIFSTAWASHCFPAPIKAIDDILPGRTSKRDLIMEIADGLGKYGIKLMLYYHPWGEKTKGNFVDNWCAITSEVGRRYGVKLAGWWFDGPGKGPFDRMAEAAKAGNPNRIITYNNGNFWPKFTDFQDYLAGEGPQFWVDQSLLRHLPQGGSGIFTGGRHEGLQAHQSFALETKGWIHNTPNEDITAPLWDKDLLVKQVKDAIERKFVPSMGIAVYEDGTASPQTLELLRALKEAVRGPAVR